MSKKKRLLDVVLAAGTPEDLERLAAEAREEVAQYHQFRIDLCKAEDGVQLFEEHFRKDLDDAHAAAIIAEARLRRMTA